MSSIAAARDSLVIGSLHQFHAVANNTRDDALMVCQTEGLGQGCSMALICSQLQAVLRAEAIGVTSIAWPAHAAISELKDGDSRLTQE